MPEKFRKEERCFVIAEAGVNHNGDIDVAKQLVDAAAEAGADAVKFQTWKTDKIVTRRSTSAEYQLKNTGEAEQYSLLKRLELTYDEFAELKRHTSRCGLMFLSTPDEEESAKFLVELGMDLIKVGSGEVTNLKYLEFLAHYELPIILSTGMSSLEEVAAAVKVIREGGTPEITLLQCVSSYPALARDCNLRAMRTMAEAFNCPAGYSDHTEGDEICLAAVALGAKVIEKHLTLDRNMEGPDQACSAEPDEFGALVRKIRNVESALGNGVKMPSLGELETRKVVRKEIVAAAPIRAGTRLSEKHLATKRGDGTGYDVRNLNDLLGRQLSRDLQGDDPINENVLEQL